MLEGVRESKQSYFLEQQVKDLEQRLADVTEQYVRISGHKPKTVKRVSIGFTAQEYKALNRASLEANLPKSKLLKSLLIKSKEIPALVG